jgi:phage shock protein PspC (stress-responsive transcriptional regulator)
MKNKDHFLEKHKELHPRVSFGIFLIVLGGALLVATNDLLGLGGVKEYFTWETVLVFIGTLLLLNLQFTGGLILISLGAWFFIENRDYEIPGIIKTIYWPGVIILIGLGFIFSHFLKRIGKKN